MEQGELNCVDESTEIMTLRGWRSYRDLVVGEPVLTLDHETGLSAWEPLLRVNVLPPRRRTMLSLETQRHSSLTTMEHRWPVIGVTRRGNREPRIPVRVWRTSQTLVTEDRLIAAAPCASLPGEQKYRDALVELVAWTWTEGHITRAKAVTIGQSWRVHPDYCDAIRAALTALFGPARDTLRPLLGTGIPGWREERQERGMTFFYLNVAASEPILAEMDSEKVVRPEFVAALTYSQLRLFFDRSIDGDGWRSKGGAQILGQRNERRNRTFEMAAVLLGRAVQTRGVVETRSDRDPSMQHYTTVFSEPRGLVGVQKALHAKGSHIGYDGIVWCPTTPNGTWLARRNGTVWYTGNCNTCYGTLTVNGVLLNNDAWCAYDLTALFDEADLRGSDRLIPSSTGVIANRRRRTVTRKDIPMVITGLYNWLGFRQTDRGMGLIANIEYLKDNLGFASTSGGGTVTASWARPDGTTRTASVHPLSLRHTIHPKYVAQAVLSLSLPAGRFT